LQKGRQEGLEKGLEKGRQEGLDEGRKTVARAMLRENIPMDSIMRCTGLLEAEIEQLRTKH
jgi:predicted transposase/invertase (TIGR01784 family)